MQVSGKSKLSFLIQGAGIAGTALAFCLARAGHCVKVVEKTPDLRPGGYKIDVRGTAVDVLDRMGLYSAATEAKVGMNSATFVDLRGRSLATIDGDIYGMREGRDVELLRGDLAHIMYSAGAELVDYRFGESIVALDDHDGKVDVTFQQGAPESFDFVVAADGLHSPIREMIFGPETNFLKFLGFHISIYSVPNRLRLSHQEQVCTLPGKRLVNYYTSDATGNAKALFFFPSPQLDLKRTGVSDWKNWLSEYMTADLQTDRSWIVPDLLNDMVEAKDFYFDALAQIRLERWSSGRIILLGDAAWCASPASGQGCSLALVGAYVLAKALEYGNDSTPEIYEKRMRAFVAENQELAHGFANILPKSRAGCWVQQQASRLMSLKVGRDLLLSPTRRRFRAAANGIELDG